MSDDDLMLTLFERFAADVHARLSQVTSGEPEEQLRTPFDMLLRSLTGLTSAPITLVGETPLPDRLGRPDFAVHVASALVGYVELKAPGTGVSRLRGRNAAQFQRFSALPNLLYCDGNEWALYRSGDLVGRVVRLSGDVVQDGAAAVEARDLPALLALLRDFLSWQPFIPLDRQNRIDLQLFAKVLAPLCRMIRDDVTEALVYQQSNLARLAAEWRVLLFPEATDEQFADAYAQTVTFALLLGRSEGAEPLTLATTQAALASQHSLLSRALLILTDQQAYAELAVSLEVLLRVVGAVPAVALTSTGGADPWLYFYEDFLAAYDPELRKAAGAYYTPTEVVQAQVRLVDDLLTRVLGKQLGFAHPDVITLDPAVGTGTYLLGVVKHVIEQVSDRLGAGAVGAALSDVARNMYGFEVLVGPYAVSELRVSRSLLDNGAHLPTTGTQIYLTDTLESPLTEPQQTPLFMQVMAEQHAKALQVKRRVPVMVCLGNPPYDRHGSTLEHQIGGWVRWGERGNSNDAILEDFLRPVREAGDGGHLKNIYNLYVYFWRWALWKVFEQAPSTPGVVSFITASSFLDGAAFSGMREHMRRVCEQIWLIDLGGEGRGARKEENVFNIQTPVTIAIAFRKTTLDLTTPAEVRFVRIRGSRQQKLAALAEITDFASVDWQACPDSWQANFRPSGEGDFFKWPLLTDLMPWQHSGVQLKRTWPIAPDIATLQRRWQALLNAADRAVAFKESGDRTITGSYNVSLTEYIDAPPIENLSSHAPMLPAIGYAYRSFDRQYIIADGRLMSRPRPVLWRSYSDQQLYFNSLFSTVLGIGPALMVSGLVPDLHHFCNRGAKDVVPLYRDSAASDPNILPGLLALLSSTYGTVVTPTAWASYLYGVLAQPAFTSQFYQQLNKKELHIPITKDYQLFSQAQQFGARLIWLHTYGERMVPEGRAAGDLPQGQARCTSAVASDPANYPNSYEYNETTQTLHIGDGQFAPVAPDIYHFNISGLNVVQSWLNNRMQERKGRKSSPLDDIRPHRWSNQFTSELLELLWVLEHSIANYPAQAELLQAIIAGPCFQTSELPAVPEDYRKAPKPPAQSDQTSMDI